MLEVKFCSRYHTCLIGFSSEFTGYLSSLDSYLPYSSLSFGINQKLVDEFDVVILRKNIQVY